MKKIVLTIILAIVTSTGFAEDSARAPVTSLTFSDGGNLFFTTSAAKINPGNCNASSYVITNNNAGLTKYYAMLLAAKGSGSKVLVRIQGCISLGTTSYPRVTLIQASD